MFGMREKETVYEVVSEPINDTTELICLTLSFGTDLSGENKAKIIRKEDGLSPFLEGFNDRLNSKNK